ncbi:RNA methyltransferase [Roseburia inulinivorans]|uniref:RNA methyltransferase n=1 Tax=Roseburia inulinivorans TaxID=360807 RepID=A0A0M6WPT4_9FIRM|nr:23S rRNA (uracil(1939)-C(5))-methyltransferase RlmD [Roseburia inulinivorans]CRL39634.1 RNA methyltransferase [Roseburia inulinivorans]
MQTKGKKKIIDNAGALQKKYAWKSEKQKKKPAAVCPYAKKCGGCDYQGMSYEQQLQEKQTYVRKNIGDYCKVLPIIGMENPYHYRNKVHAVFDVERRGKHANGGRRTAGNGHAKAAPGGVISGVYKAGTHEVINIDSCEIEDELSSAIIRDIRGLLHSFKIKTYDEDTGYGLLRHVLVRRGFHSGEVMVVLVLGSPILPSKNNFVKALRKLHPEITTVVVNINDKQTSMVLGEKETVIYGKGYIEDTLCGCTFRISPKSFYQVNPVQTEILYNKAITYAGLTGKEKVIDAYCGTGTIGLIAASQAKEVIGVELNRDAVKDAIINAKRNNIQNEQFYNADAGKFMVELAEQNEKVDVVFMDPPRSGSDEAFLSSVVKLAPKKVVYVSCNPETLARDLKYLTRHGYQAVECQPCDMFPFTKHVETVVLLSKGEIDSKKVRVEFSLEDMDMSGFQKGATYEQIKAYVLEHTGLKVSSLYISQIKRKCGLDVGQNYNLSKKEDAKVPKCPPEKEAAIRDALKYFQMI